MNDITISDNKEMLFEPKNITKETIKKYLCPQATEQELMIGIQIAKTFNLNPLKREVYFVKYNLTQPMQILTGYEVYLKRAERSGQYEGMKAWTEGKIEDGTLKGCVEIYHKGWAKPLYHEVDFVEYVQKKADGTPNRFWKEKPKTMIKKVVISQAFRLCFPDEFDGMPYTSDEVIDQEKIIDVSEKPVESPKMPLPPKIESKPQPQKESVVEDNLDEKKSIQEEVSRPISPVDTFEGKEVDKTPVSTDKIHTLLTTSKKNGWKPKEVKEWIITLGYLNPNDINEMDYSDAMKYFSKPKKEEK